VKLTPGTDVDRFGMGIPDKDSGVTVVYDSQVEAANDADSPAAIGAGIVVPHRRLAAVSES
jgi:hypothetical protein